MKIEIEKEILDFESNETWAVTANLIPEMQAFDANGPTGDLELYNNYTSYELINYEATNLVTKETLKMKDMKRRDGLFNNRIIDEIEEHANATY